MLMAQKPSSGPAWGGAGLPKAPQTSEGPKASSEFPGLGEQPAEPAVNSVSDPLVPASHTLEATDGKLDTNLQPPQRQQVRRL